MAVTVVERTSANDLSIGPRHIPTTALPGESVNIGIAGHPDTVFGPLRLIRTGQLINLILGGHPNPANGGHLKTGQRN